MGVLQKLTEQLGLPQEVVAGVARVEIVGEREVYIENHNGILEYGKNVIGVASGKKIIRIVGDGLEIVSLSDDQMRIRGLVFSVEYMQ